MKPYYQDEFVSIYNADWRAIEHVAAGAVDLGGAA